jgi:hypothetical protein
MKVLINIITQEQIEQIKAVAPNFSGAITISGQSFIPREWVHVPDSFIIPDNYKPYIKSVKWVLAHLVRRYLREYNVQQFAQGVKEAAELYGEPVPALATMVLSVAPEAEIPEE